MLHMRDLKRSVGTPRRFLFLALVSIAACDTLGVTETQSGGVAGKTLVIRGQMTPQLQGIDLRRGGKPVTDATVTVNGFALKYSSEGGYLGSLPGEVSAGGTLNLKVVSGGVTIEASGKAIATPVITGPAEGRSFTVTDSITLAWSTPTDPDYFIVCMKSCGNDGEQNLVAGSARENKISAGFLREWFGGVVPVVTVHATKSNFLKLAGSPDALLLVDFNTKSRDVLITVTK